VEHAFKPKFEEKRGQLPQRGLSTASVVQAVNNAVSSVRNLQNENSTRDMGQNFYDDKDPAEVVNWLRNPTKNRVEEPSTDGGKWPLRQSWQAMSQIRLIKGACSSMVTSREAKT
jgi:hypothetical protein